MNDFINGLLNKIDDKFIYLEQNNLGYRVSYLKSDLEQFKLNENNKVYIATNIIDNVLKYYGFKNQLVRDLFEILININTIGEKTAFLILENYLYDELIDIFKNGKTDKILQLKGIGSYTAKLIINNVQKELFNNKISDKKTKVITSLEKLGYRTKDIYKIIINIDEDMSIDDLTKFVLEQLSYLHN
ncbi:Holliday junction branch migration protein RuvA [Mycoplasma feriruminatoris]|uniref:Holliday junction branch migration complex subunit RuvA n=1 Tax=Mycoplasma feriruminatoris TaxID=1179777 RepID=A0AAQ3DLR0_9MOLU|nr:Holliday junction branch migration protein RuvA [Mycoplasma feriruminatoris]UKS54061.1 putative holliday junction ATP-dependent DNAhelicase ruvA [Mycoplasma feriruminatoris]WFQ90126.1 Holliday junction ATP-dependent DNA helicase RuvA [Mycoplasma feriruminatoris]WFQ90948.1 Holliday junction ATP-dependent DNA helicase RuvA [Mycoplasma feriruminatoris]WFQ91769.1 Holliday junction ATP-dependent DNA helicase RuvA [Mycoplasma feriruminatoris]WFQ92592.1 Holliday junction ATP-dependent DNA helicase